jgi:hypothetical protein
VSSQKQSKVEKSSNVEKVGDKFSKKTVVKPGDGPGQSRAKWVEVRNKKGKKVKMYKDFYDRGNKFHHRRHYYPKKFTSK